MWRWGGWASHPPRVGSRPLSVSRLFVISSYFLFLLSHRPGFRDIFLPLSLTSRCLYSSLVYPKQLRCYLGSWTCGPPQPPQGVCYARGTSLKCWVFVHSSDGASIPNFFRPFMVWTVPPLLCKLMSQTPKEAAFSTFSWSVATSGVGCWGRNTAA